MMNLMAPVYDKENKPVQNIVTRRIAKTTKVQPLGIRGQRKTSFVEDAAPKM
jgi:hypothetical protein